MFQDEGDAGREKQDQAEHRKDKVQEPIPAVLDAFAADIGSGTSSVGILSIIWVVVVIRMFGTHKCVSFLCIWIASDGKAKLFEFHNFDRKSVSKDRFSKDLQSTLLLYQNAVFYFLRFIKGNTSFFLRNSHDFLKNMAGRHGR